MSKWTSKITDTTGVFEQSGESIIPWSIGSCWLRWDPHLHAPETLRNNQFTDDWDACIKRIEEARPAVLALGITDYFTMRSYKEIFRPRQAGAYGY